MSHEGKRFKEFEKGYQEALASIERYQMAGDEMSGLVEWLLNTDANPYGFLPEGWAGAMGSAQGFSSLLHCIHHALYDDGEITFVSVDGEPRIVFYWRHEEDFRNHVLSEQERQLEKMNGIEREVEVLECSANEFGKLYDEYRVKDLQRCFSGDAGRLGIDFAVKHYRDYDCFDESWIDTCGDEIEKWKDFYKKVRD